MRVLILGKNGMLGHDLLKVFVKEDVIALGSSDLDVTDQEAVFEQFMTIQPDVVINATGYTKVDQAEKEEEQANEINGYAVGILAKASREIDATLVHFSTDYVFKGDNPAGYREDAATSAINAYGRSKELGEKLMVEEMEIQSDMYEPAGKYFLIRTSWLFGKHGKNFVDTMLKLGNEKKVLNVVNDQRGKPTYTMDLAQQVKFLLDTKEYPSGIYHVTNEEETSWYDFAKAIFELYNPKVTVLPSTSRDYAGAGVHAAPRPPFSTLINTKLPPLRPWKEALADYLSEKS
jgi:dTDP-4-dehydrorhamnose reductase